MPLTPYKDTTSPPFLQCDLPHSHHSSIRHPYFIRMQETLQYCMARRRNPYLTPPLQIILPWGLYEYRVLQPKGYSTRYT